MNGELATNALQMCSITKGIKTEKRTHFMFWYTEALKKLLDLMELAVEQIVQKTALLQRGSSVL